MSNYISLLTIPNVNLLVSVFMCVTDCNPRNNFKSSDFLVALGSLSYSSCECTAFFYSYSTGFHANQKYFIFSTSTDIQKLLSYNCVQSLHEKLSWYLPAW